MSDVKVCFILYDSLMLRSKYKKWIILAGVDTRILLFTGISIEWK